MPGQHDRSRIDVDRADRQVIQQAAARLRRSAIQGGYAGLHTSTWHLPWPWC
jgi:hypothetical protein